MKSTVLKRSIYINGKKTSVSLEDEFWDGLRDIANCNNTTTTSVVEQINRQRRTINLSSAIRTYVFSYFRKQIEALGANPVRRPPSKNLRDQIEKFRALAEGLKDVETRGAILRIADDYEVMAARTERLERVAEAD